MELHIGKEIEKILDDKRMPVAEFAKLVGMEERSVYHIFRRSYIHSKLMIKISKALGQNLFLYYISPEDLPSNPELQAVIDKMKEKVKLQDKEIAYLREINHLLREKTNS